MEPRSLCAWFFFFLYISEFCNTWNIYVFLCRTWHGQDVAAVKFVSVFVSNTCAAAYTRNYDLFSAREFCQGFIFFCQKITSIVRAAQTFKIDLGPEKEYSVEKNATGHKGEIVCKQKSAWLMQPHVFLYPRGWIRFSWSRICKSCHTRRASKSVLGYWRTSFGAKCVQNWNECWQYFLSSSCVTFTWKFSCGESSTRPVPSSHGAPGQDESSLHCPPIYTAVFPMLLSLQLFPSTLVFVIPLCLLI